MRARLDFEDPSTVFLMVFYSHMCPKLITKGLRIDIGDQAMLRGVLKAGLELMWASFGSQIGTFGGPGRLKMGPLELELPEAKQTMLNISS